MDSLPSFPECIARLGIRWEIICLHRGPGAINGGRLAARALSLAALGRVLQAAPWVPEGRDNPLVFPAEVLVQEPIDDGVQAAVEIGQEVARDEQPLWHPGSHFFGVNGHSEANAVQRRPADGEDHKDHEHAQKAPHATGPWAWLALRLDLPAGAQHQHPDVQVAETHNSHGQQEVHEHHGRRVSGAGRLREGARVDARVVLQGSHKEVGQQDQQGEQPDEADVEGGVPAAAEAVVGHAAADVAVAVDGDGCDVEDGANHAQTHHEGAGLAVHLPQGPAVVEDGHKGQRVGVQGYGQVSERQTHQEQVTWSKKRAERVRPRPCDLHPLEYSSLCPSQRDSPRTPMCHCHRASGGPLQRLK